MENTLFPSLWSDLRLTKARDLPGILLQIEIDRRGFSHDVPKNVVATGDSCGRRLAVDLNVAGCALLSWSFEQARNELGLLLLRGAQLS